MAYKKLFLRVGVSRAVEATGDERGKRWEVDIIKAGLSLNGTFYSAEMLKKPENLKKFEGAPCYVYQFGGKADHLPEGQDTRFIQNKVGYFENVRWDETREAMTADMVIYEAEDQLRSKLVEAFKSGHPNMLGLSIDTYVFGRKGIVNGQQCYIVEGIQSVRSVDLVSRPAAGGQLLRLVASVTGDSMHPLKLIQERRKGWLSLVNRTEGMDDNAYLQRVLEAAFVDSADQFDGITGDKLSALSNGRSTLKEAVILTQEGKFDAVTEILTPWFEKFPSANYEYPVAGKESSYALPNMSRPAPRPQAQAAPFNGTQEAPRQEAQAADNSEVLNAVESVSQRLQRLENENRIYRILVPKIVSSGLPAVVRSKLQRVVESTPGMTEASLDTLIKEEKECLKALVPSGATNLGDAFDNSSTSHRVEASNEQFDNYVAAWNGFFYNKDQKNKSGQVVRRFATVREALYKICGEKAAYGSRRKYGARVLESLALAFPNMITGDYEDGDAFEHHTESLRENWSGRASRLLRESVSSSDFSRAFGTSFYLVMQKAYSEDPRANWRQLVSSFENLNDMTNTLPIVRHGLIPDMPTVGEGDGYQELIETSTENSELLTPAKRGGLYKLTLEAASADKIGWLRKLPFALARSANLTISKNIAGHFENNTTMADAIAWVNASHSNRVTTALSHDAVVAGILAMRSHADQDDTANRLGIQPKFLITGPAKADVAWELCYGTAKNTSSQDATAPNFIRARGIEPVELIDIGLTATTDNYWYLLADPSQNETIVVAFLDGRDEPDMFVQGANNETAGAMFTADEITFKMRLVFGSVPADHRTVYGGQAT